jgi:hypothetical protein
VVRTALFLFALLLVSDSVIDPAFGWQASSVRTPSGQTVCVVKRFFEDKSELGFEFGESGFYMYVVRHEGRLAVDKKYRDVIVIDGVGVADHDFRAVDASTLLAYYPYSSAIMLLKALDRGETMLINFDGGAFIRASMGGLKGALDQTSKCLLDQVRTFNPFPEERAQQQPK